MHANAPKCLVHTKHNSLPFGSILLFTFAYLDAPSTHPLNTHTHSLILTHSTKVFSCAPTAPAAHNLSIASRLYLSLFMPQDFSLPILFPLSVLIRLLCFVYFQYPSLQQQFIILLFYMGQPRPLFVYFQSFQSNNTKFTAN